MEEIKKVNNIVNVPSEPLVDAPVAKVEKISLEELRAENNKIKDENNKKILENFEKKLGKFLDTYMSLTDEEKAQFWKSKQKLN